VIWIEAVLLIASSLFLARSSYEMFFLTPRYGPQMIFFSLIHTWPEKAVYTFFASWYAYEPFVCFAVFFALIRLTVQVWHSRRRTPATDLGRLESAGFLSRLTGWLAGPPGRVWSILIYGVAVLAAAHFAAAMTYDSWSSVLFRTSV
jgi:hypothetical protein